MVQHWADRPRAITLGADRGYDAADFVEELRTLNVGPHVAQNTSGRRSAIDKRTMRHSAYAASQRIRKRMAEAFGWIKDVGDLRQTKLSGMWPRWIWTFAFAAAAYDPVWLPKLSERRYDQGRAGLRPRLCRALADHGNGRRDRPAQLRAYHTHRQKRRRTGVLAIEANLDVRYAARDGTAARSSPRRVSTTAAPPAAAAGPPWAPAAASSAISSFTMATTQASSPERR